MKRIVLPAGSRWDSIPANWTPTRLKFVARLAYGDSLPDERRRAGDVPVWGSNGVVGAHDEANMLGPSIVVGRKGSFGKVSYAADGGFAIDTTYFVDRRYSSVNLRWLYYVLGTLGLEETSQDTGVPGLSRDAAYETWLGRPPVAVQRSIAGYLDLRTTVIDSLVAKHERLLALLAEQRTAIINQAVTKGLDPTVQMKDSEVRWIGRVPAHWTLLRVKQLGWFRGGAGFPDADQGLLGLELPFYKVKDLAGSAQFLGETDSTIDRATARRLGAMVFPQKTIVFAKIGAALLLRRFRFLGSPACIDNNMMGWVPDPERILPEFALLASCLLPFDLLVNPGAVPSLSGESFGTQPLPIPPLGEQEAIVRWVSSAVAGLDDAIGKSRLMLDRLCEYRQSLVTAAVTGQLDIPSPEVPDAP